jgi:peptidyl-tRNA hydrolase
MSGAVQYIVVRKDLVEQMGVGKTAAQVAHASLGAVIEKTKIEEENFWGRNVREISQIVSDPSVNNWLNGRFTKLVVYIKTKQKLLNLAEKLDNLNIRYKLIHDACFTNLEPEEADGTTLTCMGVIPMFKDNVPKCLQKLRLLE